MGHVSAGCGVRLRKDDPSVGETKSAGEAQGRLRSYCDIREIGQDLLPTERLFQELSCPCPCEGVGVYAGWERPGPKGLAGARFPGCPGKCMNPGSRRMGDSLERARSGCARESERDFRQSLTATSAYEKPDREVHFVLERKYKPLLTGEAKE